MQTVPTILGEPVAVPGKKNKFLIKKKAVEGQEYLFRCPQCGTYRVQEAGEAGKLLEWDCPKCAAKIYYQSKAPETPSTDNGNAEESVDTSELQETSKKNSKKTKKSGPTHPFASASDPNHAVLTWGSFLSRGKYILAPGEHFIGRKDPTSVSAVMVNDKYASTRSVSIDVVPVDEKHSGFLYKMTVHKATNPVYHNSKELAVGNSVYLEYGDIIIIGKTKLTFNKGK